ncbi:hypothetical protein K2173_015473 [Erythroxylum novogranatense]|uniref:Uncharacterized protein n=1 Tax=Erythroxylum novogranatense TaxID=1862640 RepID=A0AAV8SRR8_9ROSI|nr:hypothetical protein K2173_015473 [Erythroxylum novogranatense]
MSSAEWFYIYSNLHASSIIFFRSKNCLIAGRIPGRKDEEIQRFWLMRYGEVFASRRK